MKAGWGVEYQKDGRLKIRNFRFDEAAARAFYRKTLRNGNHAVSLFNYRPEPFWRQLLRTEFSWMGFTILFVDLLTTLAWAATAFVLWWRFA